ncbi:MAG: Hpt domain-containing protein [Candidatus Promineifilaceae bacterium]
MNHQLAELVPDYQTKLNLDREPISQTMLAQQYGDMADEMLTELLPMLLQESEQIYQSLIDAETEADAEGVWQAAHMLRGAAVSIGAVVLADLCDVVEIVGKANVLSLAAEPIKHISAELVRLSSKQ